MSPSLHEIPEPVPVERFIPPETVLTLDANALMSRAAIQVFDSATTGALEPSDHHPVYHGRHIQEWGSIQAPDPFDWLDPATR